MTIDEELTRLRERCRCLEEEVARLHKAAMRTYTTDPETWSERRDRLAREEAEIAGQVEDERRCEEMRERVAC